MGELPGDPLARLGIGNDDFDNSPGLVEFLGTGAVFGANLQQQLVTTLVDRVTASQLG